MKNYAFRECTLPQLEKEFGLRKNFSASPALDQWLQTEVDLSKIERDMLQRLQQIAIENGDVWNEQERAICCTGPIFNLAELNEFYRFNLFAQRTIRAVVTGLTDEIELSGEPDILVATGYREPKIPLFVFSEYKHLLDPNVHPAAHCLAGMLVAQSFTEDTKPIYGSYTLRSAWYFMVLEGKMYTCSAGHSVEREHIFDILWILKALKQIIIDRTA